MRHTTRALVAVALTATARLDAQTIGGAIVDLATKKPLGPARVALIDDSAHVVATAMADSATGMFYIDAPTAGRFRVLLFVSGVSFVSPTETLTAGQSMEREFRVPSYGSTSELYFAGDVTKPARPLPGYGAPRYPDVLRSRGIVGTVTTTFVVDATGKIEPRTIQILRAADRKFAEVVESFLPSMRFTPAELDGKAVRQVIEFTVAFGVVGNVPKGDLVITALGVERAKSP